MQADRYQYLDVIGEGGMATVYKGIQKSLKRPVAIKVLAASLTDNPDIKERFKRESLIIARLNHPNIVHVIDKGTTSQGRPVFVMEFIEGVTLADAIREGRFSFNEKVDVAVQVCKGLAYAHKLDVVHRDIKPANVLVDKEGFAKILDFGIASFFDNKSDSSDATLVMGTDAYMAPEAQQGLSATTKLSDVYSIGVLLYELFSGELPSSSAPPLEQRDANITQSLADLIRACIEEDPKKRPQSLEAIKTSLLLAMKGQHIAEEQASRAGQGLASKFGLLDVMREDKQGAVYLFEDKVSHSLLVIKKRLATETGFKESKLLCTLKHPNIANILGATENGSVFIVVMEYLSGGSLMDRLIAPMQLNFFIKLAVQISRGLSFAHQNRVIHGNLRPSNVLFSQDMRVKLTDFGLDDAQRLKQEDVNFYHDGGDERTEATDIFALGAMFYHMLCGQPPQLKDDGRLVKPKRFMDLDEDLKKLLQRMLSKNPKERPPNVEVVISELLAFSAEQNTEVTESPQVTVIRTAEPTIIREVHKSKAVWVVSALLVASLALNGFLLSDDDNSVQVSVKEFLALVFQD